MAGKASNPFSVLAAIKEPPPAEIIAGAPIAVKKSGAKRNNPDYRAWSGLVLKSSISNAQLKMLQSGDTRDMGDLITDLLAEWAAKPL